MFAIGNEKILEAASDAYDGWKIWKKLPAERKLKILGKFDRGEMGMFALVER